MKTQDVAYLTLKSQTEARVRIVTPDSWDVACNMLVLQLHLFPCSRLTRAVESVAAEGRKASRFPALHRQLSTPESYRLCRRCGSGAHLFS